MELTEEKLKDLLYQAYRCMLYDEMIIEQSNTWLSAEEGNENLKKKIREKTNAPSKKT
ncbi:MAG: hypothetical protein LBU83_10605 [Bacteroidales bacterium]|jgi:hypothetical protein|nr:hypothetical protein [Bacteroidales bacterium]